MQRPGRQHAAAGEELDKTRFLGAEISCLAVPDVIPRAMLRTASFSGQVALATLHEAWNDARLSEVDPVRVGLIIGGSNFQQRELAQIHEAYRERPRFLRPTYGLSFLDSDVCGMCAEVFGIQGLAYTLGGASASGQLAILHGIQAVESGQVDVCIALGALMDLSSWECQGLRSLGAMGSDAFAQEPALACRPFDRRRDGFIFGECCGAVVIEKASTVRRTAVEPYARIRGWAVRMDANRKPNPSVEGEVSVILQALHRADLRAGDIDYINPHGTGSPLGDETELQAFMQCGLEQAYINTTKSLVGHGLSAAGAVEVVATLLQMRARQLHPSRNLEDPIDARYNWVRHSPVSHTIVRALKMSMGFGGINSAVCLERI
jgi:malonyl-ACP decarboxylase